MGIISTTVLIFFIAVLLISLFAELLVKVFKE